MTDSWQLTDTGVGAVASPRLRIVRPGSIRYDDPMSSKNFDVEYLAELARIKLTPDEIKTFESQLGLVLEHVAKLNEVDVSQVEPMAHSFPIYNVFREDKVRKSLDREIALSNAPLHAHGLFIVTKVVE